VVRAVKWVVGISKAPASPPLTEGLTPLDQDRASSIADEGGNSAAAVEAQPPTPTSEPFPEHPVSDLDETPPLGWRPPAEK
jgi:hypothetical protein